MWSHSPKRHLEFTKNYEDHGNKREQNSLECQDKNVEPHQENYGRIQNSHCEYGLR
jgi:hypothetical protein